CYGEQEATLPAQWICSACRDGGEEIAVCSLCCLRGGALKPTTSGGWAHIVCALVIKEVYFKSVRDRAPVNVTAVGPERHKLNCELCASLRRSRPQNTVCVQCTFAGCVRSFHVTCGLVAGNKFQAGDRPGHIFVACQRHTSVINSNSRGKQAKSRIRQAEFLSNVNVGDPVLAKHKGKGRFYWAQVIHVTRKRHCEVDFDDGSFSDDLLLEDIMVRLTKQAAYSSYIALKLLRSEFTVFICLSF
ncbi:lysine-specific demethylase 4C, partial [Elysia marginata]